MKKTLLLIPVLAVGILASCTSKPNEEAGERTVITFTYVENRNSKQALQDMIKAYNDGQGKVDGVYVTGKNTGVDDPSASMFTKSAKYASNVIALSDTQNSFQSLAIKKDSKAAPDGFFLNLQPYADADEDFKKNTISEDTLNWFRMSYNKDAKQGAGQPKHIVGADQPLVGVPFGVKQQFNWYNKEVFKAQGVNIVSVPEQELAEYNSKNSATLQPHGYAEYKNAPFANAVKSKNLAGQDVYKVFNNCIGMNWEEQRVFFKYFTKAYNPTSSTNYAFISEYWFNYGWSVGSDVMGYDGSKYNFTLMDKSANYIATKNVTVNGNAYKAGQIIRYEDKVNQADIATMDGVYAISSGYDAIKEYLALQVETTKDVDAGIKGYGVASPDTAGQDNLFSTEQVAMIKRNNSKSIPDVMENTANASHFDICVPEQYREYEGGSTYGTGFANENLKVIGETYDGVEYTGELKKVDGTAIVGNKTCASNTQALVIPACSDPEKYQASWDFISWVATEGQKYIAYSKEYSPVAQDVLFSNDFLGDSKVTYGLDFKANALTSAEAGRGDWGYFESGAWVTAWANDFNNNVRRGKKTMTQFLSDNSEAGEKALNNMYCVIKGIR